MTYSPPSNSYDPITGFYLFDDDDRTTAPYDPDLASQLSYHSHSTNPINSPLHLSPAISANQSLYNNNTVSSASPLIISFGSDDDELSALSFVRSSPAASPQPNPFLSPVLPPSPLQHHQHSPQQQQQQQQPPHQQHAAPATPLFPPLGVPVDNVDGYEDDDEDDDDVMEIDDPMDIDQYEDEDVCEMYVDASAPMFPWWA